MEIEYTEVRNEAPLRRLRATIVLAIAKLFRVPVAIRDEFRGASPGQTSSGSASTNR